MSSHGKKKGHHMSAKSANKEKSYVTFPFAIRLARIVEWTERSAPCLSIGEDGKNEPPRRKRTCIDEGDNSLDLL